MKNLIAFLALIAFVPSAFADGAEFSHDGELRVRYETRTVKDTPSTGGTSQRFKWGTTFRSGEKLSGRLGIIANSQWGSAQKANTTITNQEPVAGNTDSELLVNEAYGTWMASDNLIIRAGRSCMEMADSTIISCNSWENVQKAYDGMIFTYDHEAVRASFFGVNAWEDTANIDGDADDDDMLFYGLIFDIKSLPEFFKMANIHAISIANQMAKESQTRFGLTLGGDTMGIDYRLTYEMQGGKDLSGGDVTAKGTMADVEVGYSMPDTMKFRIWVGYHMDSGDDGTDATDNSHYDQFHYDRHNNAGLMDVMQWGNLTYLHAGVSLEPMENLGVELAYHQFTASEEDGVNMVTGFTGNVAGESALGSEIDLTLTHSYGENLSIAYRFGTFTPGDALVEEDAQTLHFLEGKMTF